MAKSTICLNMIVKNESAVIRRCLDSVMPYIDYWVIVDTGSTDGTQEIIQEHLKSIPGELFERPWKNFGHNRTEALLLAKNKADYLLFMDADDWMEYEDNFQFPELTADAYSIRFGVTGFSYYKPMLIKSSLPWKWEGVLHEYVTCPVATSIETLTGIRYVMGCDGFSHTDKDKYLKYAKILEDALEEEPNNSRYVFYLAESYRTAGKLDLALKWYEKRTEMGGWDEETFICLLQIAKLQAATKYPLDTVINSYYRAHRYRPHRVEPLYYLAEIYNQQSRHELAYALLKSWDFLPKPKKHDSLFVEDWIEDWGLQFQLSICAYYRGFYQESLDLCVKLLSKPNIPDLYRDQIAANSVFPMKKLTSPLI